MVKILHISDTHGVAGALKGLPAADILVHSGDFTMSGSEKEVLEFLARFARLPYRHKIFIAGNHDDCLYDAALAPLPAECHYLRNSGVEIEGLRFYGVPMFMADCMTDEQASHIAAIPAGTDILITHQPPYGILDADGNVRYGSRELLARVREVSPRLHLFGHIHAANGCQSNDGTVYSNASAVDAHYNLVNKPRIIEIA